MSHDIDGRVGHVTPHALGHDEVIREAGGSRETWAGNNLRSEKLVLNVSGLRIRVGVVAPPASTSAGKARRMTSLLATVLWNLLAEVAPEEAIVEVSRPEGVTARTVLGHSRGSSLVAIP